MLTVFTPTYNREHTLRRVYNSLLNQTCKDFLWLIVDDGSTDNTNELIQEFIGEFKIDIKYYWKENGGKHTAMKMAYNLASTEWMVTLDSDDELVPSAIERFINEINIIEGGFPGYRIVEIRARCCYPNGDKVGFFELPVNTSHLDSFWQEMVLKKHNHNEYLMCQRVETLRAVFSNLNTEWLDHKLKYIGEESFWSQITSYGLTRYLNVCLRIVHIDSGNSLLRNIDKSSVYYKDILTSYLFLKSNLEYFFWNPHYFLSYGLKYLLAGSYVGISILTLYRKAEGFKFRLFLVLIFPISLFIRMIYFIKRKTWV